VSYLNKNGLTDSEGDNVFIPKPSAFMIDAAGKKSRAKDAFCPAINVNNECNESFPNFKE